MLQYLWKIIYICTMNEKQIKKAAIKHYKENVEGEPLTQEVPIDCYIEGARHIMRKNKRNFKKAIKNLEVLFLGLNDAQRLRIINTLRMCAGVPLIEKERKV